LRHEAIVSDPTRQGTTYAPAVAFGALALILMLVGGAIASRRLVVALWWPANECIVESSDVARNGSSFRAQIVVRHVVASRTYRSEPANDFGGSKYASTRAKVDAYPRGSRQVIRYDRSDPQRTRLNVGFNADTFGLPGVLAGIALPFGAVGALAFRSARNRRRAIAGDATADRSEFVAMGLFIGTIAAVSLVATLFLAQHSIEMSRWPIVEGTAMQREILSRSSMRGKRGEATTFYFARVMFAYDVGGQRYLTPVDSPDSSANREKAQRMSAERYSVGSKHRLRIDPSNPHAAAFAGASLFVLPLVFGVVGVLLAFVTVMLLRWRPARDETRTKRGSRRK
jgi:hypothetical protein